MRGSFFFFFLPPFFFLWVCVCARACACARKGALLQRQRWRPDQTRRTTGEADGHVSGDTRTKVVALKLNIFSPLAACFGSDSGGCGEEGRKLDTGKRNARLQVEVAFGIGGDLLNHCWMTFRPLKCCGWNFHLGLDEGLPRKVVVVSRLCLLLNATEQQMNVSTHHRVPPT